MSRFFNDLKKYSKYVKYSAKSSLKSEVAGSYLGWIWWVLEPVLFMLVYWFIFSVIFSNKTQYFPIFIFIGLSMWNFFNKGLNDAVLIVKNNVATISKVYVRGSWNGLFQISKLTFLDIDPDCDVILILQ